LTPTHHRHSSCSWQEHNFVFLPLDQTKQFIKVRETIFKKLLVLGVYNNVLKTEASRQCLCSRSDQYKICLHLASFSYYFVANSFFVSFFLCPSFFSLSFPMHINHSTNWLCEKTTQHYTTKPLTSCVLLCKLTSSSSSKNHQTKLLGVLYYCYFFLWSLCCSFFSNHWIE
jgi:hypothetical protein